MLVVGLTGGIASGKSTAAGILQANGAPVISADQLARAVVAPDEPGLRAVVEAFGREFLLPNGTLDRAQLGSLIFVDVEARRKLEGLLHPMVLQRMVAVLRAWESDGVPVAVCEIPLLFEVGLHENGSFIDRTWLVYVTEGEQLRRLMARDGLTEVQAAQRLAAQWPLARKRQLADVVLDNEGTRGDFTVRVAEAWNALLAEVRS